MQRKTNKELLETINNLRPLETAGLLPSKEVREMGIELLLLRQFLAEMSAMTGATEEETGDYIGKIIEEVLMVKLPFDERDISYEELYGK
jgi:hypothetical protein